MSACADCCHVLICKAYAKPSFSLKKASFIPPFCHIFRINSYFCSTRRVSCHVRDGMTFVVFKFVIVMKRIIICLAWILGSMPVFAQNDYIIKTKGAKKVVNTSASSATAGSEEAEEVEEEEDFIAANFKYLALCDWTPGMRFMVIPDKIDYIVNTFCDAATDKEVSNGVLRNRIMQYLGHSTNSIGRSNINFKCLDDGKDYYYQVPSGSFEDYCYNKMGVPTLAYLGDIDVAREKLKGLTIATNLSTYYVDTELNGNGIEAIEVPQGTEVKIVNVGVGTRQFPVKLIVADKNGKEFFQNLAISRINCGMRDDEFEGENQKHLIRKAFILPDDKALAAGIYAPYIGKKIYTKYNTLMKLADGAEISVDRLTTFIIRSMVALPNTSRACVTLYNIEEGTILTKEVQMENTSITGDIDGQHEDYFKYLFGDGDFWEGKKVTQPRRQLIRQGKVEKGFTQEEVLMSKGKPQRRYKANGGQTHWVYNNGLVIRFNRQGIML